MNDIVKTIDSHIDDAIAEGYDPANYTIALSASQYDQFTDSKPIENDQYRGCNVIIDWKLD